MYTIDNDNKDYKMFAFSLTFKFLFKLLTLLLIASSFSKACGRHSAALRFLRASAGLIVGLRSINSSRCFNLLLW